MMNNEYKDIAKKVEDDFFGKYRIKINKSWYMLSMQTEDYVNLFKLASITKKTPYPKILYKLHYTTENVY